MHSIAPNAISMIICRDFISHSAVRCMVMLRTYCYDNKPTHRAVCKTISLCWPGTAANRMKILPFSRHFMGKQRRISADWSDIIWVVFCVASKQLSATEKRSQIKQRHFICKWEPRVFQDRGLLGGSERSENCINYQHNFSGNFYANSTTFSADCETTLDRINLL